MAHENITLNLIPTGDTPSIHAAQYDVDRPFTVTLKEGEDDFTPTGYDIELQVRKVDNNIVTAIPTSTSGNVVTFNTTEQMTACSGTNLAELQLTKNDQTFATLHFYLVVQRDVLAGGVTSESAISNLTSQIAEIVPEVIGDDYYNKTEVDELIAEHTFDPTNYYDKTATDALLADKADVSDLPDMTNYYDKSETDALLNDKADVSDLPDMSNYYNKSETYNKTEVDNALSGKMNVIETKSVSGAICSFNDGGDNIPLKSCNITIEPDLSGYTETNLFVCGKNWLPMFTSTTSSDVNYTVDNNGVVTASGQATGSSRIAQYLYLPAGTYTLSGASSDSTLGAGDAYVTRVSDGVVIARDYTGITDTDKQFTLTQTERLYIACRFSNAATTSSTTRVFYPQIERGETPSDYAPYNSTTYNIPFGQTVTTGGTLDVISGELVVGGVTTQLTPVSPKTISGINNIYNDCGDTALTYFTNSADSIAELIKAFM